MSEYIKTTSPDFDVKAEIKRLKKIIKDNRSYYNLNVAEATKLRDEYFASRKTDIEVRVDDRTGREYLYDTKYNREVSSWNPTAHDLYNKEGESLHDRIRAFYNEKNNIPSDEEKNQALIDLKYLEARIRFEQREAFKNKKVTELYFDGKERKSVTTTLYEKNIAIDKKKGRLLPDGRTIFEAKWKGETNKFEIEMNNAYENSSYWTNDLATNDTIVQNKVETETKENNVVPVQKDNRYMKVLEEQRKLDQTINKNPLKDKLKISNPKDVQTYDLRNLLQIEQ